MFLPQTYWYAGISFLQLYLPYALSTSYRTQVSAFLILVLEKRYSNTLTPIS